MGVIYVLVVCSCNAAGSVNINNFKALMSLLEEFNDNMIYMYIVFMS